MVDMGNDVAAPGGLVRGATALPAGDGGAMVGHKLNILLCVGRWRRGWRQRGVGLPMRLISLSI